MQSCSKDRATEDFDLRFRLSGNRDRRHWGLTRHVSQSGRCCLLGVVKREGAARHCDGGVFGYSPHLREVARLALLPQGDATTSCLTPVPQSDVRKESGGVAAICTNEGRPGWQVASLTCCSPHKNRVMHAPMQDNAIAFGACAI